MSNNELISEKSLEQNVELDENLESEKSQDSPPPADSKTELVSNNDENVVSESEKDPLEILEAEMNLAIESAEINPISIPLEFPATSPPAESEEENKEKIDEHHDTDEVSEKIDTSIEKIEASNIAEISRIDEKTNEMLVELPKLQDSIDKDNESSNNLSSNTGKEAELKIEEKSEETTDKTEDKDLIATMSSTKGEEAKAKSSDASKDESLAQIQQILKTLPLEQLKLLKGNIFDNLDVLNQKKDSSPGTSAGAAKSDEGKLDESVEKEISTSADNVVMDIFDEATVEKSKEICEEKEKSQIKETIKEKDKLETDKEKDTPKIMETEEKEKSGSKDEPVTKKKPEVMEIVDLCLDDDDEEDENQKEAALKSTKVPATDEKSKDKPSESKTSAAKAADQKKDSTAKRTFTKECINSNCERNIDSYCIAPEFVLNFYYVTKKAGSQFVCEECFDRCCDKLEELHASLKDKKCVFDMKLAQPADLVEILDSDDDDEDEVNLDDNNENYLSREELWMVHDECDKILENIVKSIDPQSQLEIAERYMKKKIAANDVLIGKLNKNLMQIEKKSMNMYNKLYSVNKVRIQERPPVEFIGGFDPEPVKDDVAQKSKNTPSAATQRAQHLRQMQKQKMEMIENQMKQKMVAKQLESLAKYKSPAKSSDNEVHKLQKSPVAGPSIYNTDPNRKTYFAMRPRPANTWSPCEVLEEKVVDGIKLYHVKFLDSKANTGTTNAQVTGRYLAVGNEKSTLAVGRRVLAYFSILANGRKQMAPGVIGESLTMSNRYRYLVFGDDGNVEYMSKDVVFPVLDQSKNVWEDVHINLRQFLREYLSSETSKQRTVLIVRKGQRILIDRNDIPIYATVIDIDCSIMKIRYANDMMEWVYRGSKRLGLLKPTDNPQNSFQRRNVGPSMEYVTIDDTPTENVNPVRAVAKKSTSKPSNQLQPQQHHQQQQQQLVPSASSAQPAQPGIRVKILNDNKIYIDDPAKVSRLRHFTPRRDIQAKKFVIHNCGPQCLPLKNSNLSSYSPLSKPLLTCWERLIVKQKNYKAIMYKAPCGRRLRNMNEVHHFLKVSKSPLNVENFDFDITMQVLAAHDVDKQLCGLYIDDITEGQEGMKIPVVNAFDNQKPPPLIYSSKRIPTTGVNINTDLEFLSCCDCTDDCFDKTKCQCFRLTIEGAKFNSIMEQPAEEISYVYKRLLHTVPTGIYECNPNCKCSSRCLNRVVQQPIQVKMQVFRTKNRGWGLETLHDIPKGTFICIYAGLLYTEKAANEMCNQEGVEHGDEYFAELDHIETTQTLKEGYEENVRDPEDDEKDDSEDSDFRADLEDFDNNDLDFITNASRAGPREMLTRSSSRVSRSNSTATDSGQSDSQKNQRQSTKQPLAVDNSDSDSEGELNSNVRNLNLAAPKAVETVQKYDPRKFRKLFGPKERVYIMDAKTTGNVGRYFNHSCNPNLFVQNVFVDTHDPRFPWISFFSSVPIRAGEELTWNYNYEVGSVPNKVLYCECGAKNCRNRIL